MAALKREQWIWIAMGAAVLLVVYFYRKRTAGSVSLTSTAIPTGQGSLVGSTLAGQVPMPVTVTLPISATAPVLSSSDNGGDVNVALGGPAVSNTGILAPLPVRLKNWYGGNGTPIYSPYPTLSAQA